MSSEPIFFICFSGLVSSLLKYKKLFKLGARKFHFLKYKKFFQSEFFSFFELGKILLEVIVTRNGKIVWKHRPST